MPKAGWDHSYHVLPSGPTVPKGSALTFRSLSYDKLTGGWALNAMFTQSAPGNGPIIYFALATGSAAPTTATPFRLQRSHVISAFIIAAANPRPTAVIVYGSTRDGRQGEMLLRTSIPSSAFR